MRLRKKAASFISVLLSIVMVMSSVILPVSASTDNGAYSPNIIKQDNGYLVENIGPALGQAQALRKYLANRGEPDKGQAFNGLENASDILDAADTAPASNELDGQLSIEDQEATDVISSEEDTSEDASENTSVEPIDQGAEAVSVPEGITVITGSDSAKVVFEEVYASPNIPANINTLSTADSITVTWDVTNETDSYDIEANGAVVENGSSTSYVHSGLEPNTMHTYRVRAVSQDTTGEWSEPATAYTLLSTPSNLKVSYSDSDNTAAITWDAVSGAEEYEVYQDGVSIGTVNEASYTITGLSSDSLSYSVKAFNAAGNVSAMSGSVTASALPTTVVNNNLLMSTLSATTISSSLTLTEDMTYGDLTLTGGTLDLNGYTLIIEGNLIQTGGVIYVNGGTLEIAGDYRITSSSGNSYSTGFLKMTNTSDRVTVGGNFVMDSSGNHSTYLTAGVLEVKGDFTQRRTSSNNYANYNFYAAGTHKVLLSGIDLQSVSFQDYQYSRFNILVITKPLDSGYSFNYQPVWNSLMEMSDDSEAPTTPTYLAITSKTSSSVSLSWTRSTDNLVVAKYAVLRNGIKIGETTGTSYTDTGLSPNTTYTYTVKAYDGNNNASNESDPVTVTTDEGTGDPEKPDWYYINTTDADGNPIELYLSDIGGSAGESSSEITAIVKRSSDILWKKYALSGDAWADTGITYASAPGGGVVTVVSVPVEKGVAAAIPKEDSTMTASVSATSLPTIRVLDFEAKKDEILNTIYDKIGINPNELTIEDILMLSLGVVYSYDDNVTFGIMQWLHKNTTGVEPPEDNYYYMRAKAYTDAAFVSIYLTATLGSAAAALSALEAAGLSGGMALASSPTGIGTIAFGTAAITELAGAAVMTGVSFASANMAQRSQNIFSESMAKLQDIARWKLFQNIRVKNVTMKSAEEVNAWWYENGLDNPPYKKGTCVYEFELLEDTTFVRVYDKVNSQMRGGWIMKAEDIAGLTPAQIKDKYALQSLPQYMCDVKLKAGDKIRGGIAGPQPDWGGNGGATQFDLMKQFIGEFINERLL